MTGNSSSETATADAGSTYVWKLKSNPTTGYSWYLVSDCGLRITSEFERESDLCGAPGFQKFLISSDAKGTFTLTAEYKRQWENVPPAETRQLTITFS